MSPPYRIPYNRPSIVGKELEYIADAVKRGHLSGNGPYSRKCEQWIEEHCGAGKALLTHSGSGALEMAALLADIQPGDEVIMPSFTFVSTATAFTLRGAKLRFVDIEPGSLNIDVAQIEPCINEKTRAIVPVHYAGVGCEMNVVGDMARAHDLLVIEDAAQAFMATYKGQHLGTFGHLGVYSFHETKNFICGEGGALVVNDERFLERAEILHDKGTNRSQFNRGKVDKYTWVDIGSSFLPSELSAAFLFAQLERAAGITARRRRLYDLYMEGLAPLAAKGRLRLPVIPEGAEHNGHIFYVLVQSEAVRSGLITHLGQLGILAVFHYVPLHTSPMGARYGTPAGGLPVTEDVARRLLRLPLFYDLTEEEVDRVVEAVGSFWG